MGMFDTYKLAWGDIVEDVQTKQLENFMDTWQIGCRVPLGAIDEPQLALAPEIDGISPDAAPFCCLVEDWSLARNWHAGPVSLRYFSLGHRRSIFADYGAAQNDAEAREHAAELCALWAPERWGEALDRRLDLIKERNARAWLSLAEARAAVVPLRQSWRKEFAETRGQTPEQLLAVDPLRFLRAYRGPSFKGVTAEAAHEALKKMSAHWNDATLDFELAIEPLAVDGRAAEVARSCSGHYSGRYSGPRLALGAPAVASLEHEGQASGLSGSPSPERAMRLLKTGQWCFFESDALALRGRADFAGPARDALADLCLSRMGAHWAAGLMARIPELMPDSVHLGSSEIPLADWLLARLGLPSRLLEPLLKLGAAASPEIASHCLLDSHRALLGTAAERIGGLARAPDFHGEPLLVHAARAASISTLRALESAGCASPLSRGFAEAARAALENETRTAHSRSAFRHDEMPEALACAAFFFERGAAPLGPRSPRLEALLAQNERAALAVALDGTPCSTAKPLRM